MRILERRMIKARDTTLDGIRGIAALCVAFSHVAAMQWVAGIDAKDPTAWQWLLWHLGAPAVDLFMVLSGYVVAGSLSRRATPYGEYVLSRMVRLYPVAWIGVAFGLALRAAGLTPLIGMSSLISDLSTPILPGDMIGMTTMLAPIPRVNIVNPALWTLVLEMQAALAIPFILWLARRSALGVAIAGAFIPAIVAVALHEAYLLPMCGFVFGVVLSVVEDRIPQAPRPNGALLFFLVILLCRHYLSSDDPMLRVPCALAAAGVVLTVRQGAARRLLCGRIPEWLGAISYPFYAVHLPIMSAFAMTLGRHVGVPMAALASIPFSLVVARLVETAVDRHAVRLSRLVKST